jgi:hypothetical protein
MSSEKKVIGAVLVFGFLVLAGVGVTLYMKDSKTVQQAIVVRAYVVNFCMENAGYPTKEEFDQRFPKLAVDPDWFYWPAEDSMQGTFQYPMTLPVPMAPGESKYSEFMPVIYSYAVRNPCKVFTPEVF